jgi:hypothetical protein
LRDKILSSAEFLEALKGEDLKRFFALGDYGI